MYRVGERRCNKGGLMPALYAGLQLALALVIINTMVDMNYVYEVIADNALNVILLIGFMVYLQKVNSGRLRIIERQGE